MADAGGSAAAIVLARFVRARLKSRVSATLRVCVCGSVAAVLVTSSGGARVRVCVCGEKKGGNGLFLLVRRLAGLGGPWRPKKHIPKQPGCPGQRFYA